MWETESRGIKMATLYPMRPFSNLIIYDNFIGFPSISESDSGEYTCAVNDDFTTAQSTIINVIGTQGPGSAGPGQGNTALW